MKHPLEPTTYALPAGWLDSLNQPTRLPDDIDALGYAFEINAHGNRIAAEEAHSAAMIAHDIDPEAARSIAQMFAAGCPELPFRTEAETAEYLMDIQLALEAKEATLARIRAAIDVLQSAFALHKASGGGTDYVDAMINAGDDVVRAGRGLRFAEDSLARRRTS